jgi:hypothetical protein
MISNGGTALLAVWDCPRPNNAKDSHCMVYPQVSWTIYFFISNVKRGANLDRRQPERSDVSSNIGSGLVTKVRNLESWSNRFILIRIYSNRDGHVISHKPRSISASRGVLSVNYTTIEGKRFPDSNDSSKESYPVKPYGYPGLPMPEALFFGSMLVFFGIRLSGKGIVDGPLAALIGGWFIGLVGGIILLLLILPYLVEIVSYVLGLPQW